MTPGQRFQHPSWVKDLRSMEPVECVVTDANDKWVTFKPLDASDKRVGKCKPSEFRFGREAHVNQ